jgi:hypothetical protein
MAMALTVLTDTMVLIELITHSTVIKVSHSNALHSKLLLLKSKLNT